MRALQAKFRDGIIDRMDNAAGSLIIKDMFKKETDLKAFLGLTVVAATGQVGVLQQPFGKSGKVKASFANGLPPAGTLGIQLRFRKYIFDTDKKRVVQ